MKKAVISLVLAGFVVALAQGALVSATQARPLTPAERRYQPYDGSLPFCDDANVLRKIDDRFQSRESEYWNSGLAIVGYEGVREIGYRKNGLDYIPRRYCKARVFMSDQKVREMTYWVGESLGPIGIGWGIDWCISGLDRNYAYGLDCQAARP
jgi:hypothetical protein